MTIPGNIAELRFASGRHYLFVAGIALATEGEMCRAEDLPPQLSGEVWTQTMLRWVVDRINAAAHQLAQAADDKPAHGT